MKYNFIVQVVFLLIFGIGYVWSDFTCSSSNCETCNGNICEVCPSAYPKMIVYSLNSLQFDSSLFPDPYLPSEPCIPNDSSCSSEYTQVELTDEDDVVTTYCSFCHPDCASCDSDYKNSDKCTRCIVTTPYMWINRGETYGPCLEVCYMEDGVMDSDDTLGKLCIKDLTCEDNYYPVRLSQYANTFQCDSCEDETIYSTNTYLCEEQFANLSYSFSLLLLGMIGLLWIFNEENRL